MAAGAGACSAASDACCATTGLLVVYGPFRYGGQFTSHSNAAFDETLRQRDPASGIRDFEAVDALAAAQGLRLVEDCAMPANNQTLVWRRARRTTRVRV